MDYDDFSSIERLTGRAYFTPENEAGMVDLGNVQMLKLDAGLQRKPHLNSIRGRVYVDREDVFGAAPVFMITADEWASPLLPLIFAGPITDVSQGNADRQTLVLTPQLGRAYKLGVVALSNVTVLSPAGLNAGMDYVIDPYKGIIYFPIGSILLPGVPVTIQFDQDEVPMNSVAGFTQLNAAGSMTVYEEGQYDNSPKRIFDFPCSLSLEGALETRPDDYKHFTLRAAALGPVVVRSLDSSRYDELLFNDDSIVEFA